MTKSQRAALDIILTTAAIVAVFLIVHFGQGTKW
jgi:hypothetical protein